MECTQLTTQTEMVVAVITSPSTSIKINKYLTEFFLVKILKKNKAVVCCRDRTETQKKNSICAVPPSRTALADMC